MQVFAGHSAERIGPVLGIALEPLDPVEVVPLFGPTFLLADHHMILPIVGNHSFGSFR
jgi:hypothetical protein